MSGERLFAALEQHHQDEDSQTIQVLKRKKGFNDKFAFCYNWHWRSEDNFRRRRRCPTAKWSPQTRKLHDDLSSDILGILSPRLLLAGGLLYQDSLSECGSNGNEFLTHPYCRKWGT
ncbi:hypothetical protein F5X96DRAFT_665412 [Biscogniauxia mediterranea]|nr:hypothetical protein F5X96DRAFT_665412 [Biscogniauxia mediterranea]